LTAAPLSFPPFARREVDPEGRPERHRNSGETGAEQGETIVVRVSVGRGAEVLPVLSADAVLAYERELRKAFYRSRGRLLAFEDWATKGGSGGMTVSPRSVTRACRVRMTATERALERAADRLLRAAG